MDSLKYTIIKSEKQYQKYCDILENFLESKKDKLEDEIELLTFLIEKWDEDHHNMEDLDPVQLIKVLMDENNLKAVHFANILGLSKGTVSKILNYHKGLSKETIRKLSEHFGVSQEAFNRPYQLVSGAKRQHSKEKTVQPKKSISKAFQV